MSAAQRARRHTHCLERGEFDRSATPGGAGAAVLSTTGGRWKVEGSGVFIALDSGVRRDRLDCASVTVAVHVWALQGEGGVGVGLPLYHAIECYAVYVISNSRSELLDAEDVRC